MIRRRTSPNNVKAAQIARMHECIDASIAARQKETLMHVQNVTVAYHRNGISGVGFHVLTFTWRGGPREPARHMIATVFDADGYVSVLDIDELTKDNIAFAQGNSWRGDDFESALRQHIAAYRACTL